MTTSPIRTFALSLILPVSVAAAAGLASYIYSQTESGPTEYHTLAEAVRTSKHAFGAEVLAASDDDKVTRDEFRTLMRSYWSTNSVLKVTPPNGSAQEEKNVLMAVIKARQAQ